MTEFLFVVALLSIAILVHKTKENNRLKHRVRLSEQVSKFSELSRPEQLQQAKEWIEHYKNWKKRFQMQIEKEDERYDRRDGSIVGKAMNGFDGAFGGQWNRVSQDYRKEMCFYEELLHSVELPSGLTDDELAEFSNLRNRK